MVTENIVFDRGVVNGSEGVVVDIKFDDVDGLRYTKVVYVQVDGCGIQVGDLPVDVVPVFAVTTRIEYSIDGMTKGFSRRQLPLVPAYAYTDFKAQGQTLSKVIVDLATARGQGIYVMLSRVKSLSGLLILRWFPATKIYHCLPEELCKELERLHDLDVASKLT